MTGARFARTAAALAALLGASLLAASGCAKASGKVASCTRFEGGQRRAAWASCPDGHERVLECRPSGLQYKCDCLEDGKSAWFFMTLGYPPLSARGEAEVVARQNCPLWSSR
ncbi:MAG: hypothetical protein JNL38_24975 [Myxococcales bacterium]|nr:hypothetical protein [Myxococcales bacterium]